MLTLARGREYSSYVFRVWIWVPGPRVSVRQWHVSEAVRLDIVGVGMLTSPSYHNTFMSKCVEIKCIPDDCHLKWLLLGYPDGLTVHRLNHMAFKQMYLVNVGILVTENKAHSSWFADTAAVSFVFFNNKVSKLQSVHQMASVGSVEFFFFFFWRVEVSCWFWFDF